MRSRSWRAYYISNGVLTLVGCASVVARTQSGRYSLYEMGSSTGGWVLLHDFESSVLLVWVVALAAMACAGLGRLGVQTSGRDRKGPPKNRAGGCQQSTADHIGQRTLCLTILRSLTRPWRSTQHPHSSPPTQPTSASSSQPSPSSPAPTRRNRPPPPTPPPRAAVHSAPSARPP